MRNKIKEMSYDELLSVNGGEATYDGGTLPEVFCYGDAPTSWWQDLWNYIKEAISYPGDPYFDYLNSKTLGPGPF